tara:strand:+ start:65 stop:565 length:501 start_codon:yes stop_codon:yes gene_type:complete
MRKNSSLLLIFLVLLSFNSYTQSILINDISIDAPKDFYNERGGGTWRNDSGGIISVSYYPLKSEVFGRQEMLKNSCKRGGGYNGPNFIDFKPMKFNGKEYFFCLTLSKYSLAHHATTKIIKNNIEYTISVITSVLKFKDDSINTDDTIKESNRVLAHMINEIDFPL